MKKLVSFLLISLSLNQNAFGIICTGNSSSDDYEVHLHQSRGSYLTIDDTFNYPLICLSFKNLYCYNDFIIIQGKYKNKYVSLFKTGEDEVILECK